MVALLLGIAACATPYSSPAPTPTLLASATLVPTPSQTPYHSPSSTTFLDPDLLPQASLEEEGATLVCDPEPSQLNSNAGKTLVPCYDGLLLGLRALKSAIDGVDRLYLRRPGCAAIPCTPLELGTATVTGWSGGSATSVTVDWERLQITVPERDPLATWPSPNSITSPPISRPAIDGAPDIVRDRDPYPFCGDVERDGLAAERCFLDLVLGGLSAEMLDRLDVTGGTQVFRFGGQGLIVRYAEFPDGWYRDAGSVILGTAGGWSFDNWLGRQSIQ